MNQQNSTEKLLLDLLRHFILTNVYGGSSTVEDVQQVLDECGLQQIPTEYIQQVINDLK